MDKRTAMMQLAMECAASKLSRVAFAQQNNVTIRSLEYWCRKLRKETAQSSTENKIPKRQPLQPSQPSFIEIVDNAVVNPIGRPVQIEFELPGGMRIKIY